MIESIIVGNTGQLLYLGTTMFSVGGLLLVVPLAVLVIDILFTEDENSGGGASCGQEKYSVQIC